MRWIHRKSEIGHLEKAIIRENDVALAVLDLGQPQRLKYPNHCIFVLVKVLIFLHREIERREGVLGPVEKPCRDAVMLHYCQQFKTREGPLVKKSNGILLELTLEV